MKVYSRSEEKVVDMIPCFDAQETKVIGFTDPNEPDKVIIPAEMFEYTTLIDWEQRRYEIAKEILPFCAKITTDILGRGCSLGDDTKGKTIPEYVSGKAIEYADALIAELRKPQQEPKTESTIERKDIAIGEVVEFQGEHLLCVEKTDGDDCIGCAFLSKGGDCKFSGYCSKENRKDGKNVIFLKGK